MAIYLINMDNITLEVLDLQTNGPVDRPTDIAISRATLVV